MDTIPPTTANPESPSPAPNGRRKFLLILAFITGLGGFLLTVTSSVCGLGLFLSAPRLFRADVSLMLLALVAIGTGLGLPLAWQAVVGLRGKPSRRFAPTRVWGAALVFVYVLAIAGGLAVLKFKLAPTLTLPVFHILALAIPPLLLLMGAVALTQHQPFTWRQVVCGLGSGSFGAAGLAFVVELILLIIGIVIAVIVVGASPEWMQRLRQIRPAPGGTLDPELLRLLVRNPAVILALLVSLSVIVPLIEETFKSLVPALAGTWQKLTPTQGFLWGVASGAGFAVLEGLLNGGVSLDNWGSIAVLRIGSSAMHCFATGITGWGWGQALGSRKWLRLVLAYVLALGLHGVWNALSIGMGVVSLATEGPWQILLVTTSVGLLVVLAIGMIVALLWMAKRLAADLNTPGPATIESGQLPTGGVA